jgi:urease accessory protein
MNPATWHGELDLQFDRDNDGRTTIKRSFARAPLKIQRPFYPEGDVCHAVILHSAGGMVGGDRLSYRLALPDGTRALVTTAAASKIYRSNGRVSQEEISIEIGNRACLEWLPQETIIFDRAEFDRSLRVNLGEESIWCGWEIVRLGRSARAEIFSQGRWQDSIEVWQSGKPLWIDRQVITGALWHSLQANHGQPILGVLAIIGGDISPEIVDRARLLWPGDGSNHLSWSVTRVRGGLICRYRGDNRAIVRQWFTAVWSLVRERYLGKPAVIPRVWGC